MLQRTEEQIPNPAIGLKNEYFFNIYFQPLTWTFARKLRIRIVDNYAKTLENFEGFSQILKEKTVKKSYLDAFTHPIAII